LPIYSTAAQIVLNNIEIFFAQLALGLSIAASIMLGASVGENDISKAKALLRTILTFSLALFISL